MPPASHPLFNFVCRRTFADLSGESDRVRHCSDCDLDVHNFDVLSNAERRALVQRAAATQERLCVSFTPNAEGFRRCPNAGESAKPLIDENDFAFLDNDPFALVPEPTITNGEDSTIIGNFCGDVDEDMFSDDPPNTDAKPAR